MDFSGGSRRRQWHLTPVLLPGKSHGQRSLVGCSPWDCEESDTFTFHFHALEKEMATHSSVLAWRIPGTGEPGRLPSMGSHRVGHNWIDLAAAAAVGDSGVKNPPANAENADSIPGLGRSLGEENYNLVFLPGKSHGQRSLASYSPWGYKRVRCDLATKQ